MVATVRPRRVRQQSGFYQLLDIRDGRIEEKIIVGRDYGSRVAKGVE